MSDNKKKVVVRRPFYFFPYDKMKKGSKVVIYGASGFASALKVVNEIEHYYDILFYVDKRYTAIQEQLTYSPYILQVRDDYDYIVISSVSHEKQIRRFLSELSIPDEKIVCICREDKIDINEYISGFSDKLCNYYIEGFDCRTYDYLPYFSYESEEYSRLKCFFKRQIRENRDYIKKMRAIHYLITMDAGSVDLFNEFCDLLMESVPRDELGTYCSDLFSWRWYRRSTISNQYYHVSNAVHSNYMTYLLDKYRINGIRWNKDSNKVVVIAYSFFVTDGVMTGPTKAVINACNLLLDDCGFDVDLFIEDSMSFDYRDVSYLSEDRKEMIFPCDNPMTYQLADEGCYDNLDIRFGIHYSREKDREKRLIDLIVWINSVRPRAILNFSDEASILAYAFLGRIPVLNSTMSGCVSSIVPDASFGLYDLDEVKNESEKYGVDIYKKYHSLPIAPPDFTDQASYLRSEYDLNDDDYVVVTVGVDLSRFITPDFMRMMEDILIKYDRIKWVIVGPDQVKVNNELKKKKKIVMRGYEQKLSALYKMADVFVNPPRIGGGLGIAEAIMNELPILMNTYDSDGMTWLGQENTIPGNETELKEEIINAYLNPDIYLKHKSNVINRKEQLIENKRNTGRLLKEIICSTTDNWISY